MTNPSNQVKKLATIMLFERRLSRNKKPMYIITFVTDDGEMYKKFVSNDQDHWKKMFKNMGQDEPDFLKVEPLVGNKVELVIEEDRARYVNALSPRQMLDDSTLDKIIGAPKPSLVAWAKEILGMVEDKK